MNVLTEKVGPLPLVLWVAIGAGGVGLLLVFSHKSGSGQQASSTNSVNALSPTSAEAFGTLEQQQQDVVNALTSLGQNQSALGGSLATLSGSEATNWANSNQQYQSLLDNMQSGFGALGSQVNQVNTNLSGATYALSQQDLQYYNNLQNQLGAGFGSLGQQTYALSQQDLQYYQRLAGVPWPGQLDLGYPARFGWPSATADQNTAYTNQLFSALQNIYKQQQGSLNGINTGNLVMQPQ